jgi:hypothetical protein
MEMMLDRLRAEAPELLEAVTEERMTAAEGIVKTASPKSRASSARMAPPPPHPGLIGREPISGREVDRPTTTPSADRGSHWCVFREERLPAQGRTQIAPRGNVESRWTSCHAHATRRGRAGSGNGNGNHMLQEKPAGGALDCRQVGKAHVDASLKQP